MGGVLRYLGSSQAVGPFLGVLRVPYCIGDPTKGQSRLELKLSPLGFKAILPNRNFSGHSWQQKRFAA